MRFLTPISLIISVCASSGLQAQALPDTDGGELQGRMELLMLEGKELSNEWASRGQIDEERQYLIALNGITTGQEEDDLGEAEVEIEEPDGVEDDLDEYEEDLDAHEETLDEYEEELEDEFDEEDELDEYEEQEELEEELEEE